MKQRAAISIFGMFALSAIGSLTFLYGKENNRNYAEIFLVEKAGFSSSDYNQYFSLQPGHRLELEGRDEGKQVSLIITVGGLKFCCMSMFSTAACPAASESGRWSYGGKHGSERRI